jgi:surfactin synthase thioesterase subunit
MIGTMSTAALTRYLTALPRPGARVHLYCFPHAGGGAALFYPWTRQVPDWLHILPVHLPGRENRHAEAAFTNLPALVAELACELAPLLRPPFAFFGHSLGALLAYELARTLPVPPCHLFVSSSRAPHLPRRAAPICQLPDADFLNAMQTRYQALPAAVLEDRDMLALFLPVLRADFTLFDTYHYEPTAALPFPVTAYGGEQDREADARGLSAWRERTNSSFELRLFPGGHFYLKEQQTALLQAVTLKLISPDK